MKTYHCIGMMSGTSMDGVDLAYCSFTKQGDKWAFEIQYADCVPYSEQWLSRLIHLPDQSAEVFAKTHVFYGKYLGQCVNQFIQTHELQGKVDLIVSHGQTIFHNPTKRYTVQIGAGAEIAAATGIPTVCDLRSTDIAHGGQGAPIVPLGEQYLFPSYSCFINIGGIANISFHQQKQVTGYDVCMGNLLLDYFAQQLGKAYDAGGKIARSGTVNESLLALLNEQPFIDEAPPKSLDAVEVVEESLAHINTFNQPIENILATLVEHISEQLAKEVNRIDPDQVLVTGGGAFNTFLMEQLQIKSNAKIVVPSAKIIEFKEALIMAFLGLKRVLKQENVLSSVTGASKDSINGALYL